MEGCGGELVRVRVPKEHRRDEDAEDSRSTILPIVRPLRWMKSGEYAFTSGYGITLKDTVAESPKYILGLLNSRVLDFYLKRVSTTMRGGFFRYFTQFITQLPIHPINFADPADVARHDRMVALVEAMLDLHRKLAAAVTDQEKTVHQRQIVATDRLIDRLVYELYGLTAEEIGIVEGLDHGGTKLAKIAKQRSGVV